jgi:hypothetical protein
LIVVAGLVPAIHVLPHAGKKTWRRGQARAWRLWVVQAAEQTRPKRRKLFSDSPAPRDGAVARRRLEFEGIPDQILFDTWHTPFFI